MDAQAWLGAAAVAVTTPGVERIADVPYPGGHARNVLDVYRASRRRTQDAPVLLQLHGGDWTTGHKRQQALPLVQHLASRGWIVVVPNYRLGPVDRLPAPLIDAKAAMAWIRAHIRAMGGDPSFVAVAGGGAGDAVRFGAGSCCVGRDVADRAAARRMGGTCWRLLVHATRPARSRGISSGAPRFIAHAKTRTTPRTAPAPERPARPCEGR